MKTEDLSQHLALLSDADREEWKRILIALKECEGDVALLPEHMQLTLANLREKYEGVEVDDGEHQSQNEGAARRTNPSDLPTEADLGTPFSLYVKNVLHRELCVEGESLVVAVNKAFDHKWLPQELKNKEICETKYSQYESEIVQLNQWRNGLAGQQSLDEKTMAVGLAWFMKVYQLKQFLAAQH